MNEHIDAEVCGGAPERLQRLAVERLALQFGGDDNAGKSKIDGAALEFRRHFGRVEGRHMGKADEAAGMLLLDFGEAVVDELALAHIGLVEARTARQHAGIDPGALHHAHEGGNIGQQRVEQVVGIAILVELDGHAGGVTLLQFRRRVMRLEIDDHGTFPWVDYSMSGLARSRRRCGVASNSAAMACMCSPGTKSTSVLRAAASRRKSGSRMVSS